MSGKKNLARKVRQDRKENEMKSIEAKKDIEVKIYLKRTDYLFGSSDPFMPVYRNGIVKNDVSRPIHESYGVIKNA